MASRLLTDEIAKSNKLPQLSPDALNLFFLMIPHLSVHGKSLGDPHYVKGKICPKFRRLTPDRIEKCLKEISDKTNVKWFAIDGIWYIHSLSYGEHQPGLRKDRAGKDTLPDYPGGNLQTLDIPQLPDNSGQLPDYSTLGSRKEEVEVGSRKEEVEVGSRKEEGGIVEQVVLHLNTVLGTEYKSNSKKTIGLIMARVSQGFSLENFKIVINKKAAQWRNDLKMAPFLRPETLFGTKFESYLNERAGPIMGTEKTASNWGLLQQREKEGAYD